MKNSSAFYLMEHRVGLLVELCHQKGRETLLKHAAFLIGLGRAMVKPLDMKMVKISPALFQVLW